MSTVIAFDFGTSSIGAAIGQDITKTARPLCAFKARDGKPNWQEIEKVLKEWKPDYLVVGLPLNMDGTEQELTQRARKFANRLHGRFGFQIQQQDERHTKVEEKTKKIANGCFRDFKKKKEDASSAVIILESWFNNIVK